MTRPMLVTVAHGTRNSSGNEVAARITDAAAARLGARAVTAYVELCDPLLADVMTGLEGPAVVVPLLLSTGFHMTKDLPEAVAGASAPVVLGPSFGPDPLLADAQVARLLEAGAVRNRPLVMVAAGSSDPAATADQQVAVDLLARAWVAPVSLATLTGIGHRPSEVVRPGDAVSPYLLSPGFFADRAGRDLPPGTVVADVMGAHSSIVDLVCERYAALARDFHAPGARDWRAKG